MLNKVVLTMYLIIGNTDIVQERPEYKSKIRFRYSARFGKHYRWSRAYVWHPAEHSARWEYAGRERETIANCNERANTCEAYHQNISHDTTTPDMISCCRCRLWNQSAATVTHRWASFSLQSSSSPYHFMSQYQSKQLYLLLSMENSLQLHHTHWAVNWCAIHIYRRRYRFRRVSSTCWAGVCWSNLCFG